MVPKMNLTLVGIMKLMKAGHIKMSGRLERSILAKMKTIAQATRSKLKRTRRRNDTPLD
jgi:hypothetical protein